MSKLRITNRYWVIPNELLNNNEITMKAKWLYWYLQSKPDDRDFSADRIKNDTKEWIDSIYQWLKELEKFWYLNREKTKDHNWRWEWEYILSENPNMEKPSTENPRMEKPRTEKPSTENLKIKKERNTNKEIVKKNKSTPSKKNKYLEYVLLTENEYKKLVEEYWEESIKKLIKNLNNYIWMKWKKYKSHYHTILVRANKDWVKRLQKTNYEPEKIKNPVSKEQILEMKAKMADVRKSFIILD